MTGGQWGRMSDEYATKRRWPGDQGAGGTAMTTLTQAPAIKASGTEDHGGHWYAYEQPRGWYPLYADGGTFTLREARKLKEAGQVVCPSVTTIFKVLHKEQLVKWRMEKVAEACWEQHNSDAIWHGADEWIDQAIATASSASKGAADLGTRIHSGVESFLAGQEYSADIQQYVEPTAKELEARGLLGGISEACVGSLKYGFAGRCDLHCPSKLIVADLKSRKSKGKKVGSYASDKLQLAAYGYAIFGNRFFTSGTGLIYGISTTTPGLVTVHEYAGKDLVPAMEAFLALCKVWEFEANFTARVNIEVSRAMSAPTSDTKSK